MSRWLREYSSCNRKTFLYATRVDVNNLLTNKMSFRNDMLRRMNCYDEVSQFMFQTTLLRRKRYFERITMILEIDHFARIRIENIIRKKYYWSNMFKNIAKYCRIYSNCQRVRVYKHKSYENLKSISSKDVKSFHMMTMNFIIDLSFAKDSYIEKINDAILILIYKLTKYAIYISITKILNVKEFVNVFWREFVSQYDIMRNIIFDRDSLFTSHIWSIFCWHFDVKRELNIAFHLQTND